MLRSNTSSHQTTNLSAGETCTTTQSKEEITSKSKNEKDNNKELRSEEFDLFLEILIIEKHIYERELNQSQYNFPEKEAYLNQKLSYNQEKLEKFQSENKVSEESYNLQKYSLFELKMRVLNDKEELLNTNKQLAEISDDKSKLNREDILEQENYLANERKLLKNEKYSSEINKYNKILEEYYNNYNEYETQYRKKQITFENKQQKQRECYRELIQQFRETLYELKQEAKNNDKFEKEFYEQLIKEIHELIKETNLHFESIYKQQGESDAKIFGMPKFSEEEFKLANMENDTDQEDITASRLRNINEYSGAENEQQSGESCGENNKKCNIMLVNKITYDNPLLNKAMEIGDTNMLFEALNDLGAKEDNSFISNHEDTEIYFIGASAWDTLMEEEN